jgi:hypothetical protein
MQIPASHPQVTAFLRRSAFSPASGKKLPAEFEVRRFSLNKFRITRPTAVGSGSEVLLAFYQVSGTMPLDSPLSLKAKGRYHDTPFNLKVSGKSLRAWRKRTQPWPLEISFHTGEASLCFETAITPPTNGADLSGRFTLTARNIKSIGQSFGANLPDFGSLDLKGRYEAKSAGGRPH